MPTVAASSVSCGISASATITPTTATLRERLAGLEEDLRAEDVSRARQRVDLLRVGLERLRGGLEPDLADVGEHAGDQADDGDRRDASASVCSVGGEQLRPARRRSSAAAGARRSRARRAARPRVADDVRPSSEIASSDGDQHDRAVDVHRPRDLASSARLFAPLRCCFLGLVVAPCTHPTPTDRLERLPTLSWSWSEIQPATNGIEAPTTRADDDLDREADREDVELRHDARDDAERDVGHDAGDQHRRGDLAARSEKIVVKAATTPARDRGEVGRGRQRHELERAREPADRARRRRRSR